MPPERCSGSPKDGHMNDEVRSIIRLTMNIQEEKACKEN